MTDIFISYSHKDEAWKDALKQQLQVLQLHTEFAVWDDRQIQVGDNWQPAIEQAIAQAKVAILLVSSDFLSSEFVTRQEIPKFLQRREQEGLRIVPVIVRPCAWRTVPWLASLQSALKDNKPLSQYTLGSYELEEAFSTITEKVHTLLLKAKQEKKHNELKQQVKLEQQSLAAEQAVHEAQRNELVEEQDSAKPVDTAAYQANEPISLLKLQKNKIIEQRIATLSEKLSQLYKNYDTETRPEEKFRLEHTIKDTEETLNELSAKAQTQPKSFVITQQDNPTGTTDASDSQEEKLRLKPKIKDTEEALNELSVKAQTQPKPFVTTQQDNPTRTTTSDSQQENHVVEKDPDGKFNWVLLSVVIVVILGIGVWWLNQVKNTRPAVEPSATLEPATPPLTIPIPAQPQLKTEVKRLPFEPEMIPIPTGSFTMGCLPERDLIEDMDKCPESELPAHEVSVAAFEMGKYEVTFDEWDACEQAKVCPHAEDEGWGRGRRPVINVSWEDAQIYPKWLNQKTGKNYRLPTEAEWEYAARGGKDGAYPWGRNQIRCEDARYGSFGDYCKQSDKTLTVGSYDPNSFGLYDTVGNVLEWTQSNYTTTYDAAVEQSRVLRGGSWFNEPRNLRSADRNWNSPSRRDNIIGFRISRTL